MVGVRFKQKLGGRLRRICSPEMLLLILGQKNRDDDENDEEEYLLGGAIMKR